MPPNRSFRKHHLKCKTETRSGSTLQGFSLDVHHLSPSRTHCLISIEKSAQRPQTTCLASKSYAISGNATLLGAEGVLAGECKSQKVPVHRDGEQKFRQPDEELCSETPASPIGLQIG